MHLPESGGGATGPTRTAILLIHSGAQISEFLSESLSANFALSEISLPAKFDESEILNCENELRRLRDSGLEVFLFGINDGALVALQLAQLYGDEISGLIIHSFKLHGPRKLLKKIQNDLYLIDQPLMTINSEDFSDEISAPTIREVTMLNDSIDLALAEQVHAFMNEVRAGIWADDERDLIDAEFDAIISGLSLDESSPTTYLDELDRPQAEDFHLPNPVLPKLSESNQSSLWVLGGGAVLVLLYIFIGFDLFGTGAWPGVAAMIVGLGRIIWNTARRLDDGEDGAIL